MYIKFYSVDEKAVPIKVGNKNRDWYDTGNQVDFISANMSGWELRCPVDFAIEWNGGPLSTDTVVYTTLDDAGYFFTGLGGGICSIRTGYVIKTPPDYGVLLTNMPNYYKVNIHVMTSLNETDWQHFPYFINLKMISPGRVEFKKGEPLGFVTIVPYRQMEHFECSIDTILRDEQLHARYLDWLNGEPVVFSDKNVSVKKPKKKRGA
jgi:hypothetical protein